MKPSCINCDTDNELMTYSTRKRADGTVYKSYICRACRREKDKTSQIRKEIMSVFHSKDTEPFDFAVESQRSIERLSKRPFYKK